MKHRKRNKLKSIGWREWIAIPEWGVDSIKAKVDTGARSSAIHVVDLELFTRGSQDWARFSLHPVQHIAHYTVVVESRVHEFREITSSNGQKSKRPVVRVSLRLMNATFPIELTLANRDQMGFRMLIGRSAIRRRFLVDPGRSFLSNSHPTIKQIGSPQRQHPPT